MASLGSRLRQTALCGGPTPSTSIMEGMHCTKECSLLIALLCMHQRIDIMKGGCEPGLCRGVEQVCCMV